MLMVRQPPQTTRTDTLFPSTTLCRAETRADARIREAELQLREVQAKRLAARTLLASFWGGIAEGLVISEGIEKPDPRDPPLAEADTAVFDAAVDRARARVDRQSVV